MGERTEFVTEQLDAEDAKIVTLARSARARIGAAEGSAVRDTDGRTYTGCTVRTATLWLSALQVAVANAFSSGAEGLEAAAVVTEAEEVDSDSVAAVRDLASGAPIFRAGGDGRVVEVSRPS
ncbi:hypothetical protein SAMN04487905_106182 [Actinopolyspora xinjiangensis]|uniref:Cytidine deaminase n=1 Tax=Actinopolyspora xinjiangensis TaxID=405564 RepID=A0A1H0UBW6_9ACTN|nr:cytidine deaminase [Actinopolyspora xinjiangensis]SDP63621.1 hypothetical protein SAMN04487905_106182 [Actinopolyspora xinjiangensis]